MSYKLKAYGLTDIGLVRKNNEDLWAELPEINTYVLADGMGGHQAGEVAASQAVIAFCDYMKKMLLSSQHFYSLEEMQSEIEYAIQRVNAKVYRMGYSDPYLKGMGTTFCCLHLHEKGMIRAHVGDSRIYRYRKGMLTQLTEDDSLARELVGSGRLEEADMRRFTYKNIITKAIGIEPYLEPSVFIGDVLLGDIYLMCSDGLSDLLDNSDIVRILAKGAGLKKHVNQLIALAKKRGGHDNITVILLKVEKSSASKDLFR